MMSDTDSMTEIEDKFDFIMDANDQLLEKVVSLKVFYFICIYSNPPQQTGCDTRSIFKQSKTGLNSVLFFLDRLPYQV